jgi:hypothetical protein
MTDENIAAETSSANAPLLYFENATCFGLSGGVGQITIEANILRAGADNRVAIDRVVVGHLRGNLPALRSLRNAIDNVLLMAEPKSEGPAN